jgi:hypothetical protein
MTVKRFEGWLSLTVGKPAIKKAAMLYFVFADKKHDCQSLNDIQNYGKFSFEVE